MTHLDESMIYEMDEHGMPAGLDWPARCCQLLELLATKLGAEAVRPGVNCRGVFSTASPTLKPAAVDG